MRALARVAGALLVLVLVAGGVLLLQRQDTPKVKDTSGPGDLVAGRCPARTAGTPHDARRLGRDQLDSALAAGDVVFTYPSARPPAALRRLQRDLSGRYDAEVAAAGQAVVLARMPGTRATLALAWRRRLKASGPQDPLLREFADAWLGKGAPKRCRAGA